MDKMSIVQYLFNEAKAECELILEVKADIQRAMKKAEKDGGHYWKYCEYKGKNPSKAKVKANMKKIRQLTLEIEREV